MSGYWSITNRSDAGAAATATEAAPTTLQDQATNNASAQVLRLRSLFASLSGANAGTDQLVVRDGASGVGTIIWQQDLSIAANGTAQVDVGNLDLRASLGNALTIEFVAGVAGDRENVNGVGDFVPRGYPPFLP